MMPRIVLALVVALLAFVSVGILLPRDVIVERSIVIERPPATVHGLVDGFATFPTWSPWMERDPDMRFTVSDPPTGIGARFEWRGDPRQVGAGSQVVFSSVPYRTVDIRIDSDQLGTARNRFRVERVAGGARLTWRHETDLLQDDDGFIARIFARYFGLFYARWVDRDLEQGLERLGRLAAALPGADFAGLHIDRVEAVAEDIVYLTAFEGRLAEPIGDELAAAYRELVAAMDAQAIPRTGQPLTVTRAIAGRWRVDAAVPVDLAATPDPPLQKGRSPSGPAVRVLHRGPYEEVAPVYGKVAAWLAVRGLGEGGVTWEQYLSDPLDTPPEDRETLVYVLLAE